MKEWGSAHLEFFRTHYGEVILGEVILSEAIDESGPGCRLDSASGGVSMVAETPLGGG